MRLTLVLFDIDGTLVDTAGAGRNGLVRAFREVYGVDGIAEAARGVRFQGKTDPVIVEDMARAVGLTDREFRGRLPELLAVYVERLRADLARPDPRRRVLPGVRALLDALEAVEGVHLGLLTGNIERGARAKLEAFDLNRYFPGGGFASDHPDRREIARLAREKLSRICGVGFELSATVVVGDTEYDVDCARANGYRAVAVDTGWVPRDRLEAAGPDVLLPGFEDLGASLAALGVDAPR